SPRIPIPTASVFAPLHRPANSPHSNRPCRGEKTRFCPLWPFSRSRPSQAEPNYEFGDRLWLECDSQSSGIPNMTRGEICILPLRDAFSRREGAEPRRSIVSANPELYRRSRPKANGRKVQCHGCRRLQVSYAIRLRGDRNLFGELASVELSGRRAE